MSEPPLRVLYLLSRFHPHASGAERQALAQGEELSRRGHRVQVLTRAVPGCPRDEAIGPVQVRRLIAPIERGPLFGLSFVASTVRALRRLRSTYDVIHTHQGLWEAISTGLGRGLLHEAPVLVQPASSGYFGEAQELARTKGFPALRRLSLRNRHFAAISADIEREWIALGVPPGRIVRMASGVDADHFRPGAPAGAIEAALPPRPRAVFTGRLHPQKNLDLLLDIWPEVRRRSGAALVLVGDGPDAGRLRERARAIDAGAAIHFAGAVADPAEYLRAADAFALPSVAEGMSNSLLEAMATGLPCVASAIGGNDDLIERGRCGLLAAPDDRDAWTTALADVLTQPALARRLGHAARLRIEEQYALPVVVDRYVALYRALLVDGH
jgi:glycosyltransferase involved in cell wall biosynthesis